MLRAGTLFTGAGVDYKVSLDWYHPSYNTHSVLYEGDNYTAPMFISDYCFVERRWTTTCEKITSSHCMQNSYKIKSVMPNNFKK